MSEDKNGKYFPTSPNLSECLCTKGLREGKCLQKTSPLELVLQSGLGSPAIGGLGLNKNLKNRILQVPLKNWGKC